MKKTSLILGFMLIMLLIMSTSLIAATGDIPVPADYDGDNRDDKVFFRPSTGLWEIIYSSTGVTHQVTFGQSGDTPVPADYDDDGDADIVIYRDSDGTWRRQEGNWPGTSSPIKYLGSSDFIPVQADYNGDGYADIAAFAAFGEFLGKWGIYYSPDYTVWQYWFGASGDTPVPADYDGDGDADIAVFTESTGEWSSYGGEIHTYFGQSGDTPVPADYDGDGEADIAIFRESTGLWVIRYSSDETDNFINFGGSGDTPVPADYSGDGKADIAVFTELTGEWSINYIYYKATTTGNWSTTATWKTSTTVDGSYTTDATETPTASNSGGIIIDADVSITANVTIDQTTINSGKTLTVADGITVTVRYEVGTNLDINGTLSIGAGTVDANGAFDATGGAVTFTGAGNLKLSGTVTSLGTFTKSTGTVTYDGGDQTVLALDYATLSFTGSTSSSTKTFADGITKIDNHISLVDNITLTVSSESAVTVQVPTPGADGTVSRVFNINASDKTINLSNMTIKGGDISSNGESTAGYGGGIYFSAGTLNLESVIVSGSKAAYGGGIQVAGGVINIDKCTINNNEVTYWGGGVRVGGSAGATVVVTNSTFSNNSSSNYGGGFSAASGNTITITNSTFSDNTSDGVGGGISLSSPSTLTSLTIANNHSDNNNSGSEIGGGLYFYAETHSVKNCIIANNYRGSGTGTGDDFGYYGGTTTDDGYNVIAYSNVAAIAPGGFNNATTILYNTRYNTDITGYSSWTQGGVAVSGSLNLSSTLAENNTINWTQTLAVTSGSFAIDAGSNAANGSVSIPSTDQRGASRKSDVDIGAYEWWDNDASLPVTLSTFTAQYINDIPILCWTTQSETENAGWNIYRGESEEALSNEEAYQLNLSLGLIPGAGTTSLPTEYSFEDVFPIYLGTTYFYWLESVDYSGETEIYGPISLTIPEHEWENPNSPEIPKPYGLHQNFPNPFNPNTEISFMMKENCIGELSIYNVKGQKIKTIFSNLSIPRDELLIYNWDGKDESGKEVSTGVYYYKLRTTKGNFVRKMILLK